MNDEAYFFKGLLTRRGLRDLPEGSFLQSGVGVWTDTGPKFTFAEPLGTRETRDPVWTRLRGLNVTRRTFYAYRDEKTYEAYMQQCIASMREERSKRGR
jgi:hypothetical protein